MPNHFPLLVSDTPATIASSIFSHLIQYECPDYLHARKRRSRLRFLSIQSQQSCGTRLYHTLRRRHHRSSRISDTISFLVLCAVHFGLRWYIHCPLNAFLTLLSEEWLRFVHLTNTQQRKQAGTTAVPGHTTTSASANHTSCSSS